jgi:hypothetical protein
MQAEPGGARAVPWRPRAIPTPGKPRGPELQGDEGAIEEFFGQLWFFPTESSAGRPRVSQNTNSAATLVWIRKDKWESGIFNPEDCFPVGSQDALGKSPKKLNFAEQIWGRGERKSFIQTVKEAMAGRGRGGGRMHPRYPEEEGGGWGTQYPPNPYPYQMPFYQQPPMPPPPYGFYPGQPPYHPSPQLMQNQGFEGFGQARPRGRFQGGRGRSSYHQIQHATQHQQQQKMGDEKRDQDRREEERVQNRSESTKLSERFPQVVCFKCGEPGHFSSACNKPKVCFICYQKDHVVDECPNWRKKHSAAQFYGSANKGLGFYHINVESSEERFRHWKGFDNYGVFTIEEGEMDEEGVLKTLRDKCDKEWQWSLMRMEDYKYLVKFPPHKKVVDSVAMGGISYFYLNKGAVMASLKVWDGEIEPVGQLAEVWVQVRGVPPKWNDWQTIREIASCLGRLMEVDWQSFFSSFFSMIRVKIACKDPVRIPIERVLEMNNHLYLVSFKTEGFEQVQENPEEKNKEEEGGNVDGDGNEGGNEDGNSEDEDLLDDEPEQEERDPSRANKESGGNEPQSKDKQNKSAGSKQRQMTEGVNLGQESGGRNGETTDRRAAGLPACINLLQAMELEGNENDDQSLLYGCGEEDELLTLPEEWTYNETLGDEGGAEFGNVMVEQSQSVGEGQVSSINEKGGAGQSSKAYSKGKWGPIMTTRKSSRNANDTRPMMTRAQEAKRKWQETHPKGKTNSDLPFISEHALHAVATAICLVDRDGNPVDDEVVGKIMKEETNRDKKYMTSVESNPEAGSYQDRSGNSDLAENNNEKGQDQGCEDGAPSDSAMAEDLLYMIEKGENRIGGRKKTKKKNR